MTNSLMSLAQKLFPVSFDAPRIGISISRYKSNLRCPNGALNTSRTTDYMSLTSRPKQPRNTLRK